MLFKKKRVFPITEAPVRLHSFLVEVGVIGSQKPLEDSNFNSLILISSDINNFDMRCIERIENLIKRIEGEKQEFII